jgi:hypothetical protein
VKYFRVFFLAQAIIWTFGGVAMLTDGQIKDYNTKLAILITMSGFWGVVASWKYVWNKK